MIRLAKRSGEICGAYGGYHPSLCMEEGTDYDRRTTITSGGKGISRVKSVGKSWVAVQGENSICFVTCRDSIAIEPDFEEIFVDNVPRAVVSMCLGTKEAGGFAASFAIYSEIVAINFLQKRLKNGPSLSNDESIQVAKSALHYLCHGNLKDKDENIEVRVMKNGNILLPAPVRDCSNDLSEFANLWIRRSQRVLPGKGREKSNNKTSEKSNNKTSCNRETHICVGGWDSRLLKSYGFSWIAVQGEDSMCVVTQDEVTLGQGFFKDVLSHVEDNQLFGFKGFVDQSAKKNSMIRPFAAVSVVVGHGESDHHEASIAEIKAIDFLSKKIERKSDFSYVGTVQTAISALLFLAQKDLNPEEIKVCVFRNGEGLTSELLTTEIEEHLQVILKRFKRLPITDKGSL